VSRPICRKCKQPIDRDVVAFGSPETGWEHMEGECDLRSYLIGQLSEHGVVVGDLSPRLTRPPWIKPVMIGRADGTETLVDVTDVDGFLTAYRTDDNVFWRAEQGHVQNVLDELVDHCRRLRAELAKHGWGDLHYTPAGAPQDPAITALLAEHPVLDTDN